MNQIEKTYFGTNINFRSVAYSNGLWVVRGDMGIMTSDDGASWTLTLSGYPFRDAKYANDVWVAVGDNGLMATSIDGATWDLKENTSYPSHKNSFRDSIIYAIKYGDGVWVAGGEYFKLACGYIFFDAN